MEDTDLLDAQEYIRNADMLLEHVTAELARLRAIEAAAREYRELMEKWLLGDFTSNATAARSRLFALLDSPPPA